MKAAGTSPCFVDQDGVLSFSLQPILYEISLRRPGLRNSDPDVHGHCRCSEVPSVGRNPNVIVAKK